jgi:nucleoside-diphosphate-sugar epimerase
MTDHPPSGPRFLITGGGGFLGGTIIRQLLARGVDPGALRSVSRGTYPDLEAAGVEHLRGDLADPAVAARAVDGVDIIIHTAAKAGVWGSRRSFERANITSTANLLDAARAAGISRFVHTSSPSVIFDGTDQRKLDETAPYPPRYLAHYPATKAVAEQRVLAANGPDLATVALRPHLILGPGDPHLLTRLVERAAKRKLIRVGNGDNEVSFTYVEDAARAHLLAADQLWADGPAAACAGKAYFITQGETQPLWGWLDGVLRELDLPPVTRRVGPRTAGAIGAAMEAVYRLLRLPGEPKVTRFVAAQLSRTHTYAIDRARADLGYEPSLPMSEVTQRVVDWARESLLPTLR